MALAWHIVALQRRKKLPPLKSLLHKPRHRRVPQRQAWQDQMKIMQMFKGVRTHYPEGYESNG